MALCFKVPDFSKNKIESVLCGRIKAPPIVFFYGVIEFARAIVLTSVGSYYSELKLDVHWATLDSSILSTS